MVRLATTTIETSRETKNVARAVRLSTWYARGIRDTNEVVIHDPSTVLVSPGTDCSDCALVAYQRGGASHIVGWSDGGNIGLIVAMRRPDLVKRLVVIGANFKHEGMLDMELDESNPVMQMMAGRYMENSPDGPENF